MNAQSFAYAPDAGHVYTLRHRPIGPRMVTATVDVWSIEKERIAHVRTFALSHSQDGPMCIAVHEPTSQLYVLAVDNLMIADLHGNVQATYAHGPIFRYSALFKLAIHPVTGMAVWQIGQVPSLMLVTHPGTVTSIFLPFGTVQNFCFNRSGTLFYVIDHLRFLRKIAVVSGSLAVMEECNVA